jgi:hypothetical protein
MSLNTTNIARPNSSLTYHSTASNISSNAHGLEINPENNLGYGLGKIVRI